MKELTKQQSKVLACVEVYLNKTGFPPTRAEICKELGFKSPNAAEMHLRALEKKGYITIQSGSSRGISERRNAALAARALASEGRNSSDPIRSSGNWAV